MTAAIDTGALLELIWVAPVATVAVALCFSLIIVGVTRAADCRRSDHPRRASVYAAMSVLSTVVFLGGVVFAVSVIATK